MQEQRPRLILICGLPGAGKTSLARKLAEQMSAMRLCGDEWMAQLGVDLQDEEERGRLETLFWRIAQELLRLGHMVILESGFWLRSDRDEKRQGARAMGVPVELRYLEVPLEDLRGRVTQRNRDGVWGAVPITAEQLTEWAELFQAPGHAELALFDPPEPGPASA